VWPGRGLCDEPIPRSEKSYRVCLCVGVCLIENDVETSTVRRVRPTFSLAISAGASQVYVSGLIGVLWQFK
jgi:hypothetical protein